MNQIDQLSNVISYEPRGEVVGSTRLKYPFNTLLSYHGIEPVFVHGKALEELPGIMNLSLSTVIRALGMSKSSYYRAKELKELDQETVDRMSILLKIFQRGVEAFGGNEEQFNEWLHTSIRNLGDRKPIDLLGSENGRRQILNTIGRIRYNVYG